MDAGTTVVVGMGMGSVLAHEAALSVCVERIVELLKGFLPFWPFVPSRSVDGASISGQAAAGERARCAALLILAAIIGTAICWAGQLRFLHVAHVRGGYIAAGVIASAGAAFWNHILDITKAFKVERESRAKTASGQPLG
jgi:hypothetical protein